MRATYVTAIVIAVLTGIWLASGQFTADEGASEHPSLKEINARASAVVDGKAPTAVRARVIHAVALPEWVKVRGRTENKRTVEVRAETRGRVVERPAERGDRVVAGDLLCRLAIEDRQARVTEAKAAVNQARIEYQGSLSLQDRGFQSETAIAQAKARLATAQAQLEAATLDVARTFIRAPFAGVVEATPLNIGDFVQSGAACASVVDLDPMLLVGRVSERDVFRFTTGANAIGRLVTGEMVTGPVTFIGQLADPGTRTYRVEVTAPNADYKLRSGVTTELDIAVGEVAAHKISPAVLALDDEGRIGVRTVDHDNRVRFHLVEIVADDKDGVWVSGLPLVVTLITVGQQLVVAGERVTVQFQGDRETLAPTSHAGDVEGGAGGTGNMAASS